MVPTTLIFSSSYGVGGEKQHCIMFVGFGFWLVLWKNINPKWSNGIRHASVCYLGKLVYLKSSVETSGTSTCPWVLGNGLLWSTDVQLSLTVDLGDVSISRLQSKKARRSNPWLHTESCMWRRQAQSLLTKVQFSAGAFQGYSNTFSQRDVSSPCLEYGSTELMPSWTQPWDRVWNNWPYT